MISFFPHTRVECWSWWYIKCWNRNDILDKYNLFPQFWPCQLGASIGGRLSTLCRVRDTHVLYEGVPDQYSRHRDKCRDLCQLGDIFFICERYDCYLDWTLFYRHSTHFLLKYKCYKLYMKVIADLWFWQVSPLAMTKVTWKFYMLFVALNFADLIIIAMFFPETKGKVSI